MFQMISLMLSIVLDSDLDVELSESETESHPLGSSGSYSPSRALTSSPIPLPSESDNEMDVDPLSVSTHLTTAGMGEAWGRRSVTPTPDSESRQKTPMPHRVQTSRLRIRRSRSSLTQSITSPKAIHAIKSPILAASNAFSFQMQVQQIHNRLNQNAASGNDVDLQSGTSSLALRPRRLFSSTRRRLSSTPIPAPAPPPTMPLPALPLQGQVSLLSSPLEDSTQHNLLSAFKSDTKLGDVAFGRRRGLSKSSLAAGEHRINEIEEMKEN
jgi:hypothetical protein